MFIHRQWQLAKQRRPGTKRVESYESSEGSREEYNKLSLRAAAGESGIPRSTLHDYAIGKSKVGSTYIRS